MPLHHSPARLTPPRHSPRSTPPRRSAYTALANSELLQLAALSPSSHVPSPSRQRRRPRGRDAPFAQRSPRGLWRYLSALGGDKADLSAQEIEYAEEFTRRAQGASSRFALFPAAAQGAGVALSEAVAQHGRLRAIWASLTQAGRFKVLRIPRPLLLERARALLGRAGDSAECWAPPGGVATLAAFLAGMGENAFYGAGGGWGGPGPSACASWLMDRAEYHKVRMIRVGAPSAAIDPDLYTH